MVRIFGLIMVAIVALSAHVVDADEDLDFVYKPTPKETNGFPLLLEAIKTLQKATDAPAHPQEKGEQPGAADDGGALDFFGGAPADQEAVESEQTVLNRLENWASGRESTVSEHDIAFGRRFLKRNEPALKLVDQALARECIQLPEIKGFGDLLPYLSGFRMIARMQLLKARLLAEDGKLEAAYDQSFKIMDFGDKIKRSDSCMVSYLVGVSLVSIGEGGIAVALNENGVAPAKLVQFGKRLEAFTDDHEPLATIFKIERKLERKLFTEQVAQQVKRVTGVATTEMPGVYDHARTMALIDRDYRGILKDIRSRTYCMEKRWHRDHPMTVFMTFNAVGEICHTMLVPMFSKIDEKARRGRLTTHVLRVFLAIKAYHMERDALPQNLATLVKDGYLNRVPDDPFGPGKLQYSAKRRIIWSVGNDGTSDGPTAQKDLVKRDGVLFPYQAFREKDPTFCIPFGNTEESK